MNKIKILRIEKGISQNELANHFNITQQAISGYENGIRDPNSEILKKLAEYFNVSLDWLMGVTDVRNPYKKEFIETDSNRLAQAEILARQLIDMLIEQGVIKDRNSITYEHLKRIEAAVKAYADETNNRRKLDSD